MHACLGRTTPLIPPAYPIQNSAIAHRIIVIRVYGPDDLKGECNLRYACKMGREVLDMGGRALRVGVTTNENDRVIHEACMERDCYPSPLNYYNFPKSVCTSVNEVICHGIPDYREVRDGDIVNIDVTTYSRGGVSQFEHTVLVTKTGCEILTSRMDEPVMKWDADLLQR